MAMGLWDTRSKRTTAYFMAHLHPSWAETGKGIKSVKKGGNSNDDKNDDDAGAVFCWWWVSCPFSFYFGSICNAHSSLGTVGIEAALFFFSLSFEHVAQLAAQAHCLICKTISAAYQCVSDSRNLTRSWSWSKSRNSYGTVSAGERSMRNRQRLQNQHEMWALCGHLPRADHNNDNNDDNIDDDEASDDAYDGELLP